MDMLEILKQYGIDYDKTMERFMFDTDLYLHCIELFPADENFGGLDAAMAEKNYEKAFMCAHTLKGVTGNLGLTGLYKKIYDLVEALRAKDYTKAEELYQPFVEEKERVIKLISK